MIWLLILLSLIPTLAWSATVPAASCSSANVQTAIDTATNTDTVTIPSGTCAWSTQVTVPNTKGITIQGAGEGVTIIQGTAGMNSTNSLEITTSAGKFTRVTAITFDANGTAKINDHAMVGVIAVGLDTFRMDHTTVVAKGRGVILFCDNGAECSGLLDHLTITVPASESTQGITMLGDDRPEEDAPFARGFTPGTNKAFYVEDSNFNFTGPNDGTIDAYSGTRLVFRYNTVEGTTIGWHGADSGGWRGIHTFEVYRNTWHSPSSTRLQFHRSGSGFSFDNAYTGSYSGLNLSVYRARPELFVAKYGQCDGTSAWDGNTGGGLPAGFPCLDQTGYTFTQNSGGSYTSNPFYAWKNTEDGVEVDPTPSEVATYLVANRDFYAFSTATGSPQTVGVRVGTVTSRPASCTTNVGYWATDQGSWNQAVGTPGGQGVFYRCTSTDTWTLTYTPYTYPHPLQGVTSTPTSRVVGGVVLSGWMRFQ